MNASRLLSDSDRQEVVEALTRAESRTSGEIVPVVARQSGRYERSEDLVGLLLALLVLVGFWRVFQGWTAGPVAGPGAFLFQMLPVVLVVVASFALGSAAATRLAALRRPFISRREMVQEVERRAAEVFYRYRVGKTRAGTGVLVYVSLFEGMVRIKGDEGITERLRPDELVGVREEILRGLREGRLARGLKEGLERLGELLAEHFPADPDDPNELPDEVYLLE